MVLPSFKAFAGAIVQFRTTISTVSNAREQIGLTCSCRPALVFPQSLYLFPYISGYDCFMSILEYHLFFFRVPELFLGFVRPEVSFEIDGVSKIFSAL